MAFEPGARLGPYEIGEPIGAGGMGEVYRARDTTLGRDVAVKVLPEEFASDDERLARFEREARLLAQCNHANIATLYGFERHGSQRFLAMELVAGQTMQDRLAKKALPADEATALFVQLAAGLEAAHERGIVHRDLKPANVVIRRDGVVKILDFGLAKAFETESSGSGAPEDAPTETRDATEMGVLLGTPPYMSPEQTRGEAADRRSDIWAFGCVLFEALAGRAPFRGETTRDTFARILTSEPDWDAIPVGLRPLVRRCLTKDPRRRLQHIGEARIALEDGSGLD